MQPVEILKDLLFFQRGYLNANHFALRGSRPVLIDTAYLADFAQTERLLRSAGIDPCAVERIISTHTHCDHIGGNRLIQEMSGCDIALHTIGKHFVDTGDDWSTWWKYYDQQAAFFNATQALEDGDVLCVGPYEMHVLYTPGHAADGIVLHLPKEKILISSDTLWENDMAVMTIRIEGSSALFRMLASLDKIAGLDVRVVYPGHGAPFHDMAAAIDRARERLLWFLAKPQRVGRDVLKKIIVYTLMMRGTVGRERFFDDLMTTPWFKETMDLYFDGEYQHTYQNVMETLISRGVVTAADGRLATTVRP